MSICFGLEIQSTREISVIKSILLRKGLVYIFYGPMLGDGFEKITSPVRKNLEKENLKVIEFMSRKETEMLLLCRGTSFIKITHRLKKFGPNWLLMRYLTRQNDMLN